jgi:hypothetical protein
MNPFAVQYDLHNRGRQDYRLLEDALKKARAVKVTQSVWFFASPQSACEVRDWLRGFMHEKDSLVVNPLDTKIAPAVANISTTARLWLARERLSALISQKSD